MATLSNFNITSAQNQNILIYSNGEWINTSISAFYGALDGRYATNTHNHDSQYMAVGDAYLKAQTYPAASLYTRAEIDSMFSGYTPGTGGGGGGAVDGATNIGSGSSVFSSNVSGILEFRKITTDNLNLLEVAVSGNSIVLSPKAQSWSTITGRPSTFTPSAHNHSAGNITSGVFSRARLGSGTANSGTFLRGDGTWASIDVSGDLSWNNISGKPALPVVALSQANSVLTNSSTLAPGFYSTSQGLPNAAGTGVEESSWWHVLNFKHKDNNGYGAQLALELSSGTDAKLQFRTSGASTNGDTWTNWHKVYSEQYKPTKSDVGLSRVENIALNWSWGTGTISHIWGSQGNSTESYVYTPNDVRDAMDIRFSDITGAYDKYEILVRQIRNNTGTELVILGGDAQGKFDHHTTEFVYLDAEQGIMVSTPDSAHPNFQAGYTRESTIIRGDKITIDGQEVYHEGHKPTLGELGAAATNHTHDSHEVKVLGNRLTVDSDGKIRVNNTAYRAAGMYGIYDSNKIGHIWSMGSAYSIDRNGANFGNLYGLAYKHTNNPTGGTMGGGHQMVWTSNGNPTFAAGSNVWTSGIYYGNGSGLTSVNADRVDGLHAGDFLRSNASDTFNRSSGVLTFDMVGGERATSVSSRAPIEIRNVNNAGDAFMQFHISSKYATYFGLDRDTNDLFVGGYSMGDTRNRIWHDGNRTKFSPGTAFDLGEQDLNGFDHPDDAGFYFQQANARTDGNNYPALLAGSLLVQKSAQSSNIGSTQLYITYNNSGLYFRGLYGNTPGWRKVWHDGNDGAGSGLDADKLDGLQASAFTLKPEDHTTNNTNYSIVWENNAGDLYTSTAHFQYNPALRRINAGALYLSGVSNDMLTLNSTGHANLIVDRGTTGHDNNIMFRTAGSTKWRLWMGAGDDHIAFRYEPTGTQPLAIYESRILLNGRQAFEFRTNDSWLRINEYSAFSDGIYCGSSTVRTDGTFQVGSNGVHFSANSGRVKIAPQLDVASDIRFTSVNKGLYFNPDGFNDAGGVRFGGSNGNDGYMEFWTTDDYQEPFVFRMYDTGSSGTSRTPLEIQSQNIYMNSLLTIKDDDGLVIRTNGNGVGAQIVFSDQQSFDQRGFINYHHGNNTTAPGSGDGFTFSSNQTNMFVRVKGFMYVDNEISSADTRARSDIRVKRNLNEIDNALSKVNSLTGYTYDEINLNKRMASIIAQDVQKVLPEGVGEDREGMLNVSPMALIGLLVNAVKELSDEVKELKNGNV